MLPEGPMLQRMAALAGVRPADTYGILKTFGRDCAGAIQVLPEGERPGAGGTSGYAVMTADDLRQVIGALDVAPLGLAPERGFRPSLAGFQRKALLGRAPDGAWLLPVGDAPSTWILKPDGPQRTAVSTVEAGRKLVRCVSVENRARVTNPPRQHGDAHGVVGVEAGASRLGLVEAEGIGLLGVGVGGAEVPGRVTPVTVTVARVWVGQPVGGVVRVTVMVAGCGPGRPRR